MGSKFLSFFFGSLREIKFCKIYETYETYFCFVLGNSMFIPSSL